MVSYKQRKNFIELIGQSTFSLRNGSETKICSNSNKKLVQDRSIYRSIATTACGNYSREGDISHPI